MKLSGSNKKLAKVFTQMMKEHGNPDGFAINLTDEMIDLMNKENPHVHPEKNWVIINWGQVPSLYYVKDGVEYVLTIQKYFSDYTVEKIIEIILKNK